jgi:hypothetical protein
MHRNAGRRRRMEIQGHMPMPDVMGWLVVGIISTPTFPMAIVPSWYIVQGTKQIIYLHSAHKTIVDMPWQILQSEKQIDRSQARQIISEQKLASQNNQGEKQSWRMIIQVAEVDGFQKKIR